MVSYRKAQVHFGPGIETAVAVAGVLVVDCKSSDPGLGLHTVVLEVGSCYTAAVAAAVAAAMGAVLSSLRWDIAGGPGMEAVRSHVQDQVGATWTLPKDSHNLDAL